MRRSEREIKWGKGAERNNKKKNMRKKQICRERAEEKKDWERRGEEELPVIM